MALVHTYTACVLIVTCDAVMFNTRLYLGTCRLIILSKCCLCCNCATFILIIICCNFATLPPLSPNAVIHQLPFLSSYVRLATCCCNTRQVLFLWSKLHGYRLFVHLQTLWWDMFWLDIALSSSSCCNFHICTHVRRKHVLMKASNLNDGV